MLTSVQIRVNIGVCEPTKVAGGGKSVKVAQLAYDSWAEEERLFKSVKLVKGGIREGSSVLKFSDDSTFSASELSFIVLHVATNRMD